VPAVGPWGHDTFPAIPDVAVGGLQDREIRNRLGLLPHTDIEFELAGDRARIREPEREAGESARGRLAPDGIRGTSDVQSRTDEILP
jgi:hypothetical protein